MSESNKPYRGFDDFGGMPSHKQFKGMDLCKQLHEWLSELNKKEFDLFAGKVMAGPIMFVANVYANHHNEQYGYDKPVFYIGMYDDPQA